MRLNFNELKEKPKPGNYRLVERFLLFPKLIRGELRWLERACWVERYKAVPCESTHGYYYEQFEWVATHWFGTLNDTPADQIAKGGE